MIEGDSFFRPTRRLRLGDFSCSRGGAGSRIPPPAAPVPLPLAREAGDRRGFVLEKPPLPKGGGAGRRPAEGGFILSPSSAFPPGGFVPRGRGGAGGGIPPPAAPVPLPLAREAGDRRGFVLEKPPLPKGGGAGRRPAEGGFILSPSSAFSPGRFVPRGRGGVGSRIPPPAAPVPLPLAREAYGGRGREAAEAEFSFWKTRLVTIKNVFRICGCTPPDIPRPFWTRPPA